MHFKLSHKFYSRGTFVKSKIKTKKTLVKGCGKTLTNTLSNKPGHQLPLEPPLQGVLDVIFGKQAMNTSNMTSSESAAAD